MTDEPLSGADVVAELKAPVILIGCSLGSMPVRST
jgi:hypothetical protein